MKNQVKPHYLCSWGKKLLLPTVLVLCGLFNGLQAQCTGPSFDCDNDGVFNSIDLDDDNDGILDVDESCDQSTPLNGGNGGSNTNFFTRGIHFVQIDLYEIDDAVRITINGLPLLPNGDAFGFDVSSSSTPTVPLVRANFVSDNAFISSAFDLNTNGLPRVRILIAQSGAVTAFATRTTTSTALEPIKMENGASFTNIPLDPSFNTFIVRNVDGPGSDEIKGEVIYGSLGCDTDGDGLANSNDLDSDNDGCFDVVEAGFTESSTDPGKLQGTGFNSNGTVSGNIDGYTTPNDLDANGTPDFLEAGNAPAITMQPLNRTTCTACTGTFSVTATNADTFIWQVFDGSVWTDLTDSGIHSGAMTNTLTITNPDLADNGSQYRVLVSQGGNACGPFVSDTAVLTVNVHKIITNRRITFRVNKNK